MERKYFAAAHICLLACSLFTGAVFADNPIISHKYTADPNAMVYGGRVYVYCSSDEDNNNSYDIVAYTLISSDDLVNWTDHGEVFRVPRDASWASRAYAPACIEREGKFYLYFPDGGNSIGVAVADRPEGPFEDPLGKALIDRSMPNCNVQWCFDPAIFIDDDGTPYLYFGGGSEGTGKNLRGIELDDDMISVKGTAQTINAPESFEASFMHKYEGNYYFSYATTGASKIDYQIGTNPLGPFTHKGTVLPNPSLNGQNINNNNNNHSSIIEFGGQWYIFYHDRRISNAVYKRNASLDLLSYNSDGTMKTVKVTAESVTPVKNLDPYDTVQCETIDKQSGIETAPCGDGGIMVTQISDGDYIRVRSVDFGDGAVKFRIRAASASGGGSVELRLGSTTGDPAGTCAIEVTGGWDKWETFECEVNGCTGVKDLHFVYRGSGEPFRCDWFSFTPITTGTRGSGYRIGTPRQTCGTVLFGPGNAGRMSCGGELFDLTGRVARGAGQNRILPEMPVSGTYILRVRQERTGDR